MSAPGSGRGTRKRVPIVGYGGYIPGIVSGDTYGVSWECLMRNVKNPVRIGGSMEAGPESHLVSNRPYTSGSRSQVQNLRASMAPTLPRRPSSRIHTTRPHSSRVDASGGVCVLEQGQRIPSARPVSSRVNDHESTRPSRPPASLSTLPSVGYGGYIPGMYARNHYGGTWRDMIVLSPRYGISRRTGAGKTQLLGATASAAGANDSAVRGNTDAPQTPAKRLALNLHS